MKKFLSAFLVLTLLFTCVACGKTEPTNTDSTTTTESTTESTTKHTTDGEIITESTTEENTPTKEETTTKTEKEDTTKKDTSTTEKTSSTQKTENNTTVKPTTKPTTKPADTQKPSTTEKTTQKPSTTEKPYFVSLELISIDRAEDFTVDGIHALDKIYGKNQCFQYGDTVKFRVNMSDSSNGFSVYETDGCTTSVSGNIITAKITGHYGTSFLLQIKTTDKNGKTTTPYVRYKIWNWDTISNENVVREYARNKGLTLLNGCSEKAFKEYNIKIPGNSNWLSQALGAIDDARRCGCTRYTYQIVYQDAFDMGAYK